MKCLELSEPAAYELTDLCALLEACDLPVADLDASHLPGFLVARDGRRLIAAAGLQPCGDVVLLRSLAVAITHRRRGLASRLVEALERRASANRQWQIFLLTTTAQDFFAARGFRPLARETVPPAIVGTAEFRYLCPASAVCMVKTMDCDATP